MSMRKLSACAATLAVLVAATPAQARQVHQYFYSGVHFDVGNNPKGIAFDVAKQRVLVADTKSIFKLTVNGVPAGFSGLGGASSFEFSPGSEATAATLAVDNTGGATDGNFYLAARLVPNGKNEPVVSKVFGYGRDGKPLPGFPLTTPGISCGISVAPDGGVWVGLPNLRFYREFDAGGIATGNSIGIGSNTVFECRSDFDAAGHLYASKGEALEKFDPATHTDLGPFAPGSAGVTADRAEETVFTLSGEVTELDTAGNPLLQFGGPDPAHFSYSGLSGAVSLVVDPQTHEVFVLKGGGAVDVFSRDPGTVTVPEVVTSPADGISATAATLHGTVNADNVNTTDCHFEWGSTESYGNTAACLVSGTPTTVFSGSADQQVTAALGSLVKGHVYHYRLAAKNGNEVPSFGRDRSFSAADPPSVGESHVNHVTTDSARVVLAVNPNGAATSFHVEIGPDTNYGTSFPVPDASPPELHSEITLLSSQTVTQEVSGLEPQLTYHYRIVATNSSGTTNGPDHTFTTFAAPSNDPDACANALARQQTGATGLLDCRGYELVSAPFTGGYDVRSDLDASAPLQTSRGADGAALYSMESGTIPGIAGNPTNRGPDPYVATRGADGWATRYVGLPSTNPYATGPFSSPLLASDESLRTFAFGGSGICNPCFSDGSTNIPVRMSDGSLVEGMAGTEEPGPAAQAGTVRVPLSADGSTLVFGSDASYEPGANTTGTDATIYAQT